MMRQTDPCLSGRCRELGVWAAVLVLLVRLGMGGKACGRGHIVSTPTAATGAATSATGTQALVVLKRERPEVGGTSPLTTAIPCWWQAAVRWVSRRHSQAVPCNLSLKLSWGVTVLRMILS